LKRTRRVEVIRYRRSSGPTSNDANAEPDLASEQAFVEALLTMPGVIGSPIELASDARRQRASPVQDQKRLTGMTAAVRKDEPANLIQRWLRKARGLKHGK